MFQLNLPVALIMKTQTQVGSLQQAFIACAHLVSLMRPCLHVVIP